MPSRLRLNKPAVQAFFRDEKIKGVRLKLTPSGIRFKPVFRTTGPDVIPITEYSRGGITIEIDPEGELSSSLVERLRNPYRNPFFMLQWASGDWIEAVPFTGKNTFGQDTDAPSRFRPSMRAFLGKANDITEMESEELPRFVHEIREAKSLVEDYDAKHITGRPPKEITQARQKLNLFKDLAREIVPLDPVKQAVTLLQRFVGAPMTPLPSTPRESVAEIGMPTETQGPMQAKPPRSSARKKIAPSRGGKASGTKKAKTRPQRSAAKLNNTDAMKKGPPIKKQVRQTEKGGRHRKTTQGEAHA